MILKGSMLNDIVKHFFQSLSNRINGEQDPLLGQRWSFKVAKNPFIQMLHAERCYCITVSTFGCDTGEINYYNSLFKGKITDSVKSKTAIGYTLAKRRLKWMLWLCSNNKTKLIVAYTISSILFNSNQYWSLCSFLRRI